TAAGRSGGRDEQPGVSGAEYVDPGETGDDAAGPEHADYFPQPGARRRPCDEHCGRRHFLGKWSGRPPLYESERLERPTRRCREIVGLPALSCVGRPQLFGSMRLFCAEGHRVLMRVDAAVTYCLPVL